MNYTIEEKSFICANRPMIKIENIGFEAFCACEGEDGPDMQGFAAFLREEAVEAENAGMVSEGAAVTFRFRDMGAPMEQKYVSFHGEAQFFDDEAEEFGDYVFDAPEYVFEAVADADGRFEVTVPMWIGPMPDGDELTLDRLKRNHARFRFDGVVVGNQFVGEQFGVVGGFSDASDGEKAEKESVRYFLSPDTEEDED